MSGKITKFCVAALLAATVASSAAVAACNKTSTHPRATITIEFNNETYEMQFTLYRNMYPQTVQHFIELADAGFYNDMVVHDYRSTDWVTGAYTYNGKDNEGQSTDYVSAFGRGKGAMGEYLEFNSKESAYYELMTKGIADGSMSASVYRNSVYPDGKETVTAAEALPTLIGEFSENGHRVEDGKALTSEYGTLKMFYYTKDVDDTVVVQNSFGQIMPRDYKYNCATSLFSLQVDSTSIYDASRYAVFGTLKDDKAKEALQQLTGDIADYITGISSSSSWNPLSVDMQVDKEDKFADDSGRDIDVTFTVTPVPLIVRTVKITKK